MRSSRSIATTLFLDIGFTRRRYPSRPSMRPDGLVWTAAAIDEEAGGCDGYIETMIRPSPELDRFEREYARSRRDMTYLEALEIFNGLWAEAEELHPDFPGEDWEAAIEPDMRLARVLNGLPPDG